MCNFVSQNDEEGLGVTIFWLDAVCKFSSLKLNRQPARNHNSAGQSACRWIISNPSAISSELWTSSSVISQLVLELESETRK
jgi:hypothetical protein